MEPIPERIQTCIKAGRPGPMPGLVVSVTIQDGSDEALFLVDFTTHTGRRAIAEVAQWAMPRGYRLTTVKVRD